MDTKQDTGEVTVTLFNAMEELDHDGVEMYSPYSPVNHTKTDVQDGVDRG